MAENPSPRQMARDLLQGIAPPRPLFLPIIFSLGARVESLPLPAFLTNPTKISNAQRQIHGRLPADGVTCYFDPYLEVEALGAALRWQSDDQPPSVCWPAPARKGELPQGLRSPEDAVKAGRIGIAAEVIRRLNSVLRYDTLLMAGVSGPFTLAARLAQMSEQEVASPEDLPSSALDLAAAMLTQAASAFVDAGAHVILIHEDVVPRLSAESCEDWTSLLSPTFNIIRFYGALPVLLLTSSGVVAQNFETLASLDWDGILCPVLHASSRKSLSAMDTTKFGVALPLESLSSQESTSEFTCTVELHPALITTAGDIPVSTDIKRLAAIFNKVRLSQ
jgi:uroporphyrinogen-III decarboxylase